MTMAITMRMFLNAKLKDGSNHNKETRYERKRGEENGND